MNGDPGNGRRTKTVRGCRNVTGSSSCPSKNFPQAAITARSAAFLHLVSLLKSDAAGKRIIPIVDAE